MEHMVNQPSLLLLLIILPRCSEWLTELCPVEEVEERRWRRGGGGEEVEERRREPAVLTP